MSARGDLSRFTRGELEAEVARRVQEDAKIALINDQEPDVVAAERFRMQRPWVVMRLELRMPADVCLPPGGDFLICYICPLCGALVDWRRDSGHLIAEGCNPAAVNYLVIEQEQFAGIR